MEELEIKTNSPQETGELAERLAGLLEAGDFLALEGELGTGKTCFVQGLARGLGTPGRVTSPTFSLIHEYPGGRLPLYHFDVYRLRRPEELEDLGYEEYFYGDGVCAVEWSGLIGSYLPAERLDLKFMRDGGREPAADSGSRRRCILRAGGARGRQILDRLARLMPPK